MRPYLVALSFLVLIAASAQGQPVWEPIDDELLRITTEGGQEELTPANLQRVRFWTWYYRHGSHMEKVHDGTLLKDDFNDPGLDQDASASDFEFGAERFARGPWRIWHSDPALQIQVEDGMLSVKGRTSLASVGQNFNGLVSKRFGATDVVLVVDMKSVAPDSELPGQHLAMVHLCGSVPDLFSELRFGRSAEGASGWSQYHHAEIVSKSRQGVDWRTFGDEQERFHTVRFEHEAATQLTKAWVLRDGRWEEVGPAQQVIMSTAQVELKIDVPAPGMPVECYYDNCRLYGRPETHPARILVSSSVVGETDVAGVGVQLTFDQPDTPTVCAVTDEFGWADLELPSDLVYPVSAQVRFQLSTGETWDSVIDRDVLEGLYPGDIWVAHLNALDIRGKDRWWKVLFEDANRHGAQLKLKAP